MQWQFLAALLLSLASFGQSLPQVVEVPFPAAPPTAETLDSLVEDGAAVIGDDLICAVCIKFFNNLKHSLTSQRVEKDLEKIVLNQICPHLQKKQELECETAVRAYGPVVFKAIRILDSRIICEEIVMCPGSPERLVEDLQQKSPVLFAFRQFKLQAPLGLKITGCQECVFFMTSLMDALTSDDAMMVVFMLVDRLCPHEPSGLRDQCIPVLHDFAPKFIRMMVDHFFNPPEICRHLQVCPKGEPTNSSHIIGAMEQATTHPSVSTTPRTHAREGEISESQPVSQTMEQQDTTRPSLFFATLRTHTHGETTDTEQVSPNMEIPESQHVVQKMQIAESERLSTKTEQVTSTPPSGIIDHKL